MTTEEKTSDLQVGIVMGELKAGIDRLQRSGDRAEAAQVHILSALSTLQAEVTDHRIRLDALHERPRLASFTTESVRAVVAAENEKQSEKNSESIRVAQMEVVRPLEQETARQTATLEKQTKTLTAAQFLGGIIAALVYGIINYLTNHR